MTTYTIPSPYTIVGSNALVVRDAPQARWEDFTTDTLQTYFENGIEQFEERFTELKQVNRPFSTEEQYELLFMLEALIHARATLADSPRPSAIMET